MTAFSLFLVTTMILFGGIAVDSSGIMKEIVHLQAVADSAAHAALYTRDYDTAEAAKQKAVEISQANMPRVYFGDVLAPEDIEFGDWDADTRTFTPDPDAMDAVRVTLFRSDRNANPYRTLLLWLVDLNAYDIQATSVYEAYNPMCFREGFIADGEVNVQSNNSFQNGFCIHSNSVVSINSNNVFEPGTIVSMPDLYNLQLPASGMETNTGLDAALREGSYNIRIVNRLDEVMAGAVDPNSRYFRDYLTDLAPIALTARTISAADLAPGRVYNWDCGGDSGTISGFDGVISDVLIKTTCKVNFSQGATLESSTVMTTSTDAESFKGPSGVVLGRNDNCAPGGGSQLVTMGGINIAANLEMYGSQMLAYGQIDFAANADGLMGASMISHAGIDGTSNMDMGACGSGMEDNFVANYFRLVQ